LSFNDAEIFLHQKYFYVNPRNRFGSIFTNFRGDSGNAEEIIKDNLLKEQYNEFDDLFEERYSG
jgi:hypothetical protein